MHVAVPAGPNTEIFVDRGPRYGREGGPAVDEDRFMEIWNVVFMQNEVDERGEVLADLPQRNIDTGSGLERVAVILQEKDNVFETDLLAPLLETAQSLTGRRYGEDEKGDVSLRIMAEHGRATTVLMADGVLPSNEGRGYVLRRMLRRAVTHAKRLGVDRPVMTDLADTTIGILGDTYPELVSNKAFVLQVAASEEDRFLRTYAQGMSLFEEEVERATASGTGVFPGDAAFRLHDTFGFQEQLTLELAADAGLAVDTDTFGRLMEEQRTRAQQAHRRGDVAEGPLGEVAQIAGPTEFVGYEVLEAEGRVVGLVGRDATQEVAAEGDTVRVVLSRTPFFAEGGGQVGDAGTLRAAAGVARVTDTRPGPGGTTVHEAVVEQGELRQGEEVQAVVDADRRAATARSHTATHVVHHSIRQLLGEHARQAGSLVAPGRLRFDFTHYEGVPRDVLEEVEYVVNSRLAQDEPVRAYETTAEFARSQGAMALFGEKYGDIVRVVEVGDYSIELCGGTHVRHTGEVALVRVVSEGSIGSGFRRVEALTGPDALQHVNAERRLLEEVVEALGGGDPAAAPERVRQAVGRIKQLETELGKIRKADREREVERLAASAMDVAGVPLVVARLEGQDADALREMATSLRSRLEPRGRAAAVLATSAPGRGLLVAACTKDLVAAGVTAPALLEPAARAIGGGAGGKPPLAFAGGPRAEGVADALATVPDRLVALLDGS